MRAAVARDPLAVAVPAGVGATIFAFALGSTSIDGLRDVGQTARWLALLGLVVIAAAWARARVGTVDVPRLAVAATSWLVALALVSTAWSVNERLSAGRAISFALLLGAVAALAYRCAGSETDAARVLTGIVGGAAAVAVAGIVILAIDPGAAIVEATVGVPARFNGLGENANTVPLLLGVTAPLVAWLVVVGRGRGRLVAAALAVVFAGTIAASASRGAVVSAVAGVLVFAAFARAPRRQRLAVAASAVGLAIAAVALMQIPDPKPVAPPAPATQPAAAPPRYLDVQGAYPLEDDVGHLGPEAPRRFLGTSGRGAAWRAAASEAADRPLLGYGFGTEDRVFPDRYADFVADRAENAYLGLALQLGAIGLASFGVLAAALLLPALRRQGGSVAVRAACAGAFAAGLVAAIVQSFFYSAGNIATLAFWTCGALGAVVARDPSRT